MDLEVRHRHRRALHQPIKRVCVVRGQIDGRFASAQRQHPRQCLAGCRAVTGYAIELLLHHQLLVIGHVASQQIIRLRCMHEHRQMPRCVARGWQQPDIARLVRLKLASNGPNVSGAQSMSVG